MGSTPKIISIKMNQLELNKLVAFWKTVLSLGDWCVTAKFVSSKKTIGGGVACCDIFETTKDAKIKILRFSGRSKQHKLTLQDYEVDLVHEMIHIHLDAEWEVKDRAGYVSKEKYIEAQARALIAIKRGNPYLFHPKEDDI
jgi:hypothetical protein